jgi:hypothetical protein
LGRLDAQYGSKGTGLVVGAHDWVGFIDMEVVGD